jgi:hypothetical protein
MKLRSLVTIAGIAVSGIAIGGVCLPAQAVSTLLTSEVGYTGPGLDLSPYANRQDNYTSGSKSIPGGITFSSNQNAVLGQNEIYGIVGFEGYPGNSYILSGNGPLATTNGYGVDPNGYLINRRGTQVDVNGNPIRKNGFLVSNIGTTGDNGILVDDNGYVVDANGDRVRDSVYAGLNNGSGYISFSFANDVQQFGAFVNYAPGAGNTGGYTGWEKPTISTYNRAGDLLSSFDLSDGLNNPGAPIATPGNSPGGGSPDVYDPRRQYNQFQFRGIDEGTAQIASFRLSGSRIVATGTPDGYYPAASVPEPFTIIGTLVGGTAALRLRKKLKASNKD